MPTRGGYYVCIEDPLLDPVSFYGRILVRTRTLDNALRRARGARRRKLVAHIVVISRPFRRYTEVGSGLHRSRYGATLLGEDPHNA